MTDWHTADWHLGHQNVIGYSGRPWGSAEEMNEALVARHNERVRPGDTVWVHGDVALRRSHLAHVSRFNGRKILIAGNHDSCWDGHKRAARAAAAYLDAGFAEIQADGIVPRHILGNRPVMLSHLPYADPADPDQRYASKRPVDRGLPLLCGHVHEKWRVKDRMINVGVDVNDWYPVPAEQLAEELKAL
jgi:calcineurin-like phosphoesterase family protein